MKIAIVHYWLLRMRGGEKVIDALCEMYPQADIFTHAYDPEGVSDRIRAHKVTKTFISSLPRANKAYKSYLPLMPMALEQLDLSDYDLVISSESGPAKGVITRSDAAHVCYCHTPMRYLWNMYHEYASGAGLLKRMMIPPLSHYLRMWDVSTAARVDSFVANSRTVASRIKRYYNRDSEVIYPPVDVDDFLIAPNSELEDFYLMAGELVAYKRPDLAVRAFNQMKRKLVVIGGGDMLDEIRRLAGPTVSVLGSQPFDVLRSHYARCKALIFPGEEDFGLVPVEAMASGRPVLAFGRGGATETVVPGLSGAYFNEQTVEAIIQGVESMDKHSFDPARIVAHARQFGRGHFLEKMRAHIDRQIAAKATN